MTSPFRGPFGGGGGGDSPPIASQWPPEGPPSVSITSYYSGVTGNTGGSTQITASLNIAPILIQNDVFFDRVGVLATAATAAGTGSVTHGHMLGLYTLNAGSALSLVSSFMGVALVSQNSVTAQTFIFHTGTNSTATNATTTAGNAVGGGWSQNKIRILHDQAATLRKGQYWVAEIDTVATVGSNIYSLASIGKSTEANSTMYHMHLNTAIPVGKPTMMYLGIASTTTNVSTMPINIMPASINTSAISGTNTSQAQIPAPYFYKTG